MLKVHPNSKGYYASLSIELSKETSSRIIISRELTLSIKQVCGIDRLLTVHAN